MYSEHPGKEFGQFVLTAGKIYNDAEADKGNEILNYDIVSNSIVVSMGKRNMDSIRG